MAGQQAISALPVMPDSNPLPGGSKGTASASPLSSTPAPQTYSDMFATASKSSPTTKFIPSSMPLSAAAIAPVTAAIPEDVYSRGGGGDRGTGNVAPSGGSAEGTAARNGGGFGGTGSGISDGGNSGDSGSGGSGGK